jgi:hypothetical protein
MAPIKNAASTGLGSDVFFMHRHCRVVLLTDSLQIPFVRKMDGSVATLQSPPW